MDNDRHHLYHQIVAARERMEGQTGGEARGGVEGCNGGATAPRPLTFAGRLRAWRSWRAKGQARRVSADGLFVARNCVSWLLRRPRPGPMATGRQRWHLLGQVAHAGAGGLRYKDIRGARRAVEQHSLFPIHPPSLPRRPLVAKEEA